MIGEADIYELADDLARYSCDHDPTEPGHCFDCTHAKLTDFVTRINRAFEATRTVTDIPKDGEVEASAAAMRSLRERMKADPDGQHCPSVGTWINALQGSVKLAELERDEARSAIVDYHKTRIRKQTEREEAMGRRIAELEAALRRAAGMCCMGVDLPTQAFCINAGTGSHECVACAARAALSPTPVIPTSVPIGSALRPDGTWDVPAPAQPATATTHTCINTAATVDGSPPPTCKACNVDFDCKLPWHAAPPSPTATMQTTGGALLIAPSSPAAREATKECPSCMTTTRIHNTACLLRDPAEAASSVISSTRPSDRAWSDLRGCIEVLSEAAGKHADKMDERIRSMIEATSEAIAALDAARSKEGK